jgi:3-hydroxymyristoyl/3-hydroxydecanoyl-(acyl carrier protein) dehydratase
MANNDRPVLLPEVLGKTAELDTLVLKIRIPEDLAFFPGHFPGTPIVPGVVQVQWAMHFAKQCLGLQGRFHHMEVVKFKELLLPGQRLELHLRHQAAAGKLHFSFRSEKAEHSSGRIYFYRDDV